MHEGETFLASCVTWWILDWPLVGGFGLMTGSSLNSARRSESSAVLGVWKIEQKGIKPHPSVQRLLASCKLYGSAPFIWKRMWCNLEKIWRLEVAQQRCWGNVMVSNTTEWYGKGPLRGQLSTVSFSARSSEETKVVFMWGLSTFQKSL